MNRMASFITNLVYLLIGFFIGVSLVFGCLRLANNLKERIKSFAYLNQVVVLAKGAVWGGYLPDYTEMFLEDLKEVDHASQSE